MCIAILKPKDKTISKETLQTCFNSNKDGCGFAYIDNGEIKIDKFMDFKSFYEEYIKVESLSNMLIHFRIATHGGINLQSTHPFKLNDRMALIHNGIISGYGDKEKKSDTVDFIDKVIGNISYRMWRNPSFRQLVGDAIGYSKLVILDKSGDYFIINEEKGTWDNGVWYSNTSYKPKVTTTSYSTKYSRYYDDDDYGYGYGYGGWYDSYYNKAKTKDELDEGDDYEEKLIYKCSKCGQEFYKGYDNAMFHTCPTCKSYDTLEVGFRIDGEDYLYEDEVKKDSKVIEGKLV